ncbi:MAG: divalent cation tolerance protein CutA [Nitrospirales bacterium]|nr:divalent-cation tolerance protein CutA [Nitrospirales bacterium]
MQEIVVLITVSSEGEATSLSRVLIENGLAACVNIIPGVRSIFKWDGQIAEEQELYTGKNRRQEFDPLISAAESSS